MRTLLATMAAALAFAGSAAAQDGCERFAWPIARERAAFAAPAATAATGDALPAFPDGAVVVRLQPKGDVPFVLAPERQSGPDSPFAGLVRLPAIARAGIYQVTLSADAWLDVVQDGRYARAVGSSGRRDCPPVRKSVRLELGATPVTLQFSGVTSPTITFAISAVPN